MRYNTKRRQDKEQRDLQDLLVDPLYDPLFAGIGEITSLCNEAHSNAYNCWKQYKACCFHSRLTIKCTRTSQVMRLSMLHITVTDLAY